MKRISLLWLGVFLVGLLLVGNVPTWGQATTQLNGVVTDPSGAAVPNALNSKRFDVQTAKLELDQSTSFGNYTHLLTNPRVMQFGLRYQF